MLNESLAWQRADIDDEWVFHGAIAFGVVLGAALITWWYLAIARVWRRSLKILALLLGACGVLVLPGGALRIAAQWTHLHPLFIALSALNTALIVWYAFDAASALWRLSSQPPRPGYVQALAMQLASRPWDRLNRFLDLPRTPWRNPRSVIAYLLSAASLLSFSICLAYLFLGGGVDTQLATLAQQCTDAPPRTLQGCIETSRQWAWHALLLLGVSIVGLKAALALRAVARKLSALPASQALQGDTKDFALYLRPFPVDDVVLPPPRLPLLSGFFAFRALPVLLEEELFDVCDGFLPLIAAGTPGTTELRGAVAYRESLQHADWQARVAQRVQGARVIVMVLSSTPGVLWELQHVLQHDAWRKTLFLMDPAAREPGAWAALMAHVMPALQATQRMPPQQRFTGRPLGFFFRDGDVVQICNDRWSTTSYRIAFTQFMAEHATHR